MITFNMSIIKNTPEQVPAQSWLEQIAVEWKDYGVVNVIINNRQVGQFEKKLNEQPVDTWKWFQLVCLTDVPWQIEWLEKVILKGVPIDRCWTQLGTGHQVTVFDLIETVEGGIRPETRDIINKISNIYEILFLRKDVQHVLDILNDLEDQQSWLQMNFILSCYVLGPLNDPKPLMHYIVLMERYDLVRGLLSSASTLHAEFKSDTYLEGWINMTDEDGGTVLHITSKQRRLTWTKWFISNHADPLVRDIHNKTPFHYVIEKDYIQVFWDKLAKENQDITLLNELLVCGPENIETLCWLLENGADPNTKGSFKTAAKDKGFIKTLVAFGGDPTTVQPTEEWETESIVEWLECGGSGGMNYADFCLEHLTGIKTANWICFLISLHNGFLKQASAWWGVCENEQKDKFKSMVNCIKPETSYMKQYKNWVEKVTNMCDE